MILLAAATAHGGDVYRWTDASGHVHFSDRAAAGSKAVAPAPLNTFKAVKHNPDFYGNDDAVVKFNYYFAYPMSRSDLPRALSQASPVSEGGKKFLGHTHWQLDYHYTTKIEGGLCHVISANAQVTITYTMPQLGNEDTLSPDIVDAFHDYYGHLLEHEKGHGESGKMAAKDLVAALYQVNPAADCATVDAAATSVFNDMVRKYNDRDRAYDARTNHGVTQGAEIKNYL